MPVSNSYEGYSQWSPGSNEKGQSMNDVSLYDGGDTGLSFPEFKPRQFTKSEPAQRRNLKTVILSSYSSPTVKNLCSIDTFRAFPTLGTGILAVKVSSSPECRTSSPCGTQKNVKRKGSK